VSSTGDRVAKSGLIEKTRTMASYKQALVLITKNGKDALKPATEASLLWTWALPSPLSFQDGEAFLNLPGLQRLGILL